MKKNAAVAWLLNEFSGNSALIFTDTCLNAVKLYFILYKLGFGVVALHGKLTQQKRLAALNRFKSKDKNILIATDVASRGLDIPFVDLVINYDVPQNSKSYIHRVGRTARAGRSGNSITIVTQYDVVMYQRIEHMLQKKLD
jgi:ATP-dependent RNA helicase DDX47/RRP3